MNARTILNNPTDADNVLSRRNTVLRPGRIYGHLETERG